MVDGPQDFDLDPVSAHDRGAHLDEASDVGDLRETVERAVHEHGRCLPVSISKLAERSPALGWTVPGSRPRAARPGARTARSGSSPGPAPIRHQPGQVHDQQPPPSTPTALRRRARRRSLRRGSGARARPWSPRGHRATSRSLGRRRSGADPTSVATRSTGRLCPSCPGGSSRYLPFKVLALARRRRPCGCEAHPSGAGGRRTGR
jgi:hypothetical protein